MPESRHFVFTNVGVAALSSSIAATDQSFDVVDGSLLPELTAGQIATLVLRDDANGLFEVMNMTARSDTTLTVERGAEHTSQCAWPSGTVLRNALTAAFFKKLAAPSAANFRTSRPYPIVLTEALDVSGRLLKQSPSFPVREAMDNTATLESGALLTQLNSYNDYPAEALDLSGDVLSGVLVTADIIYSNYAPEALDVDGDVRSGVIDTVLVRYTRYAAEAMNVSGTLRSGALT